jgi:DNA-binding response OmpR family regulator
MDGYNVLRRLRQEGLEMPVIILTSRGDETAKIQGFRFGADDYVTKPFSVLELLARVEARLRRRPAGDAAKGAADDGAETLRFGDITILPGFRAARLGDSAVSLRPREFDLLLALARRRGEVVSRESLLKEVWGYRAAVHTRTVDSHVAELRRKLEEDPSQPRHILTVYKRGYRLV